MSRKIKDIKDKNTGELVYPRTHVSAVVLSSDSTLEDLVEVKQDKIDDLDEIRAGAAKGKTALQSVPSEYVTETELSNKGYATISALNNKVDAINGKQLSTEDFTTALKTKLEGLSNYDDTELSDAIETLRGDFDNIVSGDTTTAIKTFNEVIAFLDGLTDTQDLESIIASIEQQIAGKMDKVTLATVATSGSYNDLSNKPTIPAAVTESTVSGWGFTKNTGTYSKPSGGIPKSDLASAVQTSLGKADTALQSYTEQYKGTVTGVKINGTTKNPSSGVVDLGTVITSHQDISVKQDKLVSGTNIKTINGESILGSGDITISGGSGGGSGAYAEVNHGTSDTTFTLTPNTFHIWDEVSALTLTLGSETAGVANEYLFQFNSGSEATTLTMSDDIKWTEELIIEPNRIYQVSILKGLASVLSWEVEASITFPITLEMGNNGENGVLLYNYFADTYGQATAGTAITEEIYNNGFGTSLLVSTIEYGEHSGYTGYWLNDYDAMRMSWVLQSDGYMIRVTPNYDEM